MRVLTILKKTTVVPSKANLFEYVIGKRKSLEEAMATRNRDGSVAINKESVSRGRAKTKINSSIQQRQQMLGLKFGTGKTAKPSTVFIKKRRKSLAKCQILTF